MIIDGETFLKLKGQKVLGLNPPVYDFSAFDLWAKPLGLLNTLAFLKEQGREIFFFDSLYEAREKKLKFGRWQITKTEVSKPKAYAHIPRRYFRFALAAENLKMRLAKMPTPDIILITSIMTYWYLGVFEAVQMVKEIWPQVPVVVGGIYASLCPEHALLSGADYVLQGNLPGRAKKTPLYLYEAPSYGIISTSYGCPFHCQYCASKVLAPKFEPRPLEEILADLDEQLADGTISDLAFYDDALLWDKENLFYPLCEYLQKNYPHLQLHTPNGLAAGQIDETCAGILQGTGFKTVRLSLEGIDRYTQKLSSDKIAKTAFTQAVKNLLKAGYQAENIDAYVLAGLPGQEVVDLIASLDYVRSLGLKAKICEFSPIPQTPLFAAAVEKIPALAQEPLWHNNTIYTTYVSGAIKVEELAALKRNIPIA